MVPIEATAFHCLALAIVLLAISRAAEWIGAPRVLSIMALALAAILAVYGWIVTL